MNDTKYIWEKLGKAEILCQLAEEAAELSQAALKLRRALTQKNPTPVTVEEAEEHLLEEFADVNVCLDVLFEGEEDDTYVDSVYDRACIKEARWASRIRERNGEEAMK